jgi:hypothetical protein
MTEQEKLYHSALSACAEMLDNMDDSDPLIDVPMFLAAKLRQLRAAGAAKGGNTNDNGSSELATIPAQAPAEEVRAAALIEARNQALEDAATIVQRYVGCNQIAAAIRALAHQSTANSGDSSDLGKGADRG